MHKKQNSLELKEEKMLRATVLSRQMMVSACRYSIKNSTTASRNTLLNTSSKVLVQCRSFASEESPSAGAGKIELKIEPLPRVGEKPETKRARLLYQSRKRGILETDLLLSRFAEKYLKTMTLEEMEEYDQLLDLPDWDIYYWATNNENMKPCPEKWKTSEIMAKLKEVAQNKKRDLLRMPELY